MSDTEQACCAHLHVEYRTRTSGNLTRGWWECHDCKGQFIPVALARRVMEVTPKMVDRAVTVYAERFDPANLTDPNKVDHYKAMYYAIVAAIDGPQRKPDAPPTPQPAYDRCPTCHSIEPDIAVCLNTWHAKAEPQQPGGCIHSWDGRSVCAECQPSPQQPGAREWLKERGMLRTELPEDVLMYLFAAMGAYAAPFRINHDTAVANWNLALDRAEAAKSSLAVERQRAESLREALAEAGIVLEALHIAQGTGVTAEIAKAVGIVRAALTDTAPPQDKE